MTLLFLLQDFPYPPTTGINRKVYGLLSYLASRGWKCDVLCFGRPEALKRISEFEAAIPGVKVLSIIPLSSGIVIFLKKFLSILRGLPPSFGGFSSREFRTALTKAISAKAYNVVHYDVINMAQYLPLGPKIPSVLSSNDAISLFYEGMIRESHGLFRRLYLTLAKSLIKRFERRVYPKFSRVHVVSEQDSQYLKNICPGLSIEVIPIAAEESFIDFIPSRADLPKNMPRIVFTGNLDIPGIANGLLDFLDNAYSDVVANSCPFELYVLGPNASLEDEKRISAFHGVKYFRWVEDYKGFLSRADILLALDRSGTGIKTRVLDAMALGKPVVGTPIMFSGISAQTGRHCLICKNAKEIGAAVKLLLNNTALIESLGATARELMLTEYTMKVVGPKWETLYKSL